MIDKAFILPSNCNILTYTKMGESLPEMFKSNSKCSYHDSRYTNINVPLYNKGSNTNKVLLDKTYNKVKPHIYLNDDIFYDIEFNFTFKNENQNENKLHGITSYSDYSNLNIQNMYHNCKNDNFELFKIPIINLLSLEPYSTLIQEIFYTDSLKIEYPDIDTFNSEFLLPFLELLSDNDILKFNDIKEKNEIFNSYVIIDDFEALLIDVNYKIKIKQILKKGTIIYYYIKTDTFILKYGKFDKSIDRISVDYNGDEIRFIKEYIIENINIKSPIIEPIIKLDNPQFDRLKLHNYINNIINDIDIIYKFDLFFVHSVNLNSIMKSKSNSINYYKLLIKYIKSNNGFNILLSDIINNFFIPAFKTNNFNLIIISCRNNTKMVNSLQSLPKLNNSIYSINKSVRRYNSSINNNSNYLLTKPWLKTNRYISKVIKRSKKKNKNNLNIINNSNIMKFKKIMSY